MAGGHLQAMLKLAATVGQDLWSIGAHNARCGRDELIAACPRTVSGLPETAEETPGETPGETPEETAGDEA
jgi:hypothetical protein